MKKWLKRLAVTGLIATIALSLTACGQKESSKSGKKVTIEYFNQKKEMSGTLKEIIKDFMLMAKVEHLKGRYETVDEAEQFLNIEMENL